MIIIPARLASTRFPRKVLHEIEGYPMVILTALRAKEVDDVIIATDDEEVLKTAKRHGFEAVLTSKEHASGTDRVNEAAALLGLQAEEIIVNVQADEPFIEPEVIESVKELTQKHAHDPSIMLNTAYKELDHQEAADPNKVKVVTTKSGFALYFSRSPIPYDRESLHPTYKLHLGIYGYTKKMLERFCHLESAPLEAIEKLEQLRALYHGYKIALTQVQSRSFGIDTPEDLRNINILQ